MNPAAFPTRLMFQRRRCASHRTSTFPCLRATSTIRTRCPLLMCLSPRRTFRASLPRHIRRTSIQTLSMWLLRAYLRAYTSEGMPRHRKSTSLPSQRFCEEMRWMYTFGKYAAVIIKLSPADAYITRHSAEALFLHRLLCKTYWTWNNDIHTADVSPSLSPWIISPTHPGDHALTLPMILSSASSLRRRRLSTPRGTDIEMERMWCPSLPRRRLDLVDGVLCCGRV